MDDPAIDLAAEEPLDEPFDDPGLEDAASAEDWLSAPADTAACQPRARLILVIGDGTELLPVIRGFGKRLHRRLGGWPYRRATELRRIGTAIASAYREAILGARPGDVLRFDGFLSQADFGRDRSMANKLIQHEHIALPHGQTVPLAAFFRRQAGRTRDLERVRFVCARPDHSPAALAREYRSIHGFTVESRPSEDSLRRAFSRIHEALGRALVNAHLDPRRAAAEIIAAAGRDTRKESKTLDLIVEYLSTRGVAGIRPAPPPRGKRQT